ncbi:branched-chain amino acid ABC transporter permease [Xanthobacteraceae bacterium Astr-EGSB]|uniref:branched-chain amino acid ABC transporter permease n=1 Tax=Astrobacterium formosum TaxID=3069710 RepID=UPI0027B4FC2E|nr:branched-chain amino acid ABC transporter permease [Xanthobacteraceae bacterium Astr-EGSB]
MGAYELTLVAVVSINVMLALGLNLITGFCGQVSLGHAAFFGTGAYAAALMAAAGWPLPVVLVAGGVTAAVLGLLVGFTSLRVREDFLAITTMGVGFVFVGFVRKQGWLGAEMGLTNIPDHGLGDIGFILMCLGLVAAMAAISAHIKRSWLGFGFAAVADDEATARTLGINVPLYKLAAFVIGTFLAGVAGAVYVYFTRFIIPGAFGFTVSISILSMVIVGGVGSLWGVIVAAVLLTLLPEFSRVINDYKLLLYGALIVLTMRFAPDGLAGIVTSLSRRLRRSET